MPTINFSSDDAAIVWAGAFADSGGPVGGHNYRVWTDHYDQFRTKFTGSSITLAIHSDYAQPFDVFIDGIQVTSPTVDALSVWSSVTLASGLADAPHELVVKIKDAYVPGFGVYTEKDTNSKMLQVTGAAPALSAPTIGGVLCSNPHVYVLANDAVNFKREGMYTVSTSNSTTYLEASYSAGGSDPGHGYPGMTIRFRGSPTSILIFGARVDVRVTLVVDGHPLASVVPAPNNEVTFDWMPMARGLDGGSREYAIIFDQRGTSDVNMIAYQIMLVGGDVAVTPAAARDILASFGDSRSTGWWQTGVLSSQTYGALLAKPRGYQHVNAGISASTVTNTQTAIGQAAAGPGSYGEERTIAVTRFGATCKVVVTEYGINDFALGVLRATFKDAYRTMLQALVDGLPSASIWVLGILYAESQWYGGRTEADLIDFNLAIQEAIALVTPHTSITYFPPVPKTELVRNGDFSPNYMDGLHLSPAGYGVQVRGVENQLAGIGGGAVPSIGSPLIRGVA